MPSQKNQHYVPKVHLRPFTNAGNDRSINLFNIRSRRLINGASVSGQCASNYFYGDDLILENIFSKVEGQYATAVREVERGLLSNDASEWMRMFMIFQYLRTKRAVDRTRQQVENGLLAMTARGRGIEGAESLNTSHEAMLALTLSTFHGMLDYSQDLKLKVIKNDSRIPFVTSDAPLIFTNRFYVQQLRLSDFGAASAGALIFLPLGPQHCAVAYDAQVYTADANGSFLTLSKTTDVLALNEMQYIYASQNIYFGAPGDGQRVAAEFLAVEHLRQERFFVMTELAETARGQGTRTFRRVGTSEEADSAPSKLYALQSNHPRPRHWPSCIRFRQHKKFYFNGAAVGHVRKEEWLRGEKPMPSY